MSASVGYGRLGYNVGAWNTSPDTLAVINSQLIQSSVNWGEGWGRESWSEGAWNSPIGLVLVGTGAIFSTTGQQLNSALNFSTAQASSTSTISGQAVTISLANVTTIADTINSITGLLANTFIGTYSISADGNSTIVVPEFEMSANLGSITTGTANRMDIVGQALTSTLSSITTTTENFISISGINANANVSSFIMSTGQILDMTGQEMTIALATIIPNSNNILNMTGIQANVTPTTLRFWDDIASGNNEIWTNI